jgi:hypothetical protein
MKLTEEGLRKALAKVWQLGQTYWQQADSDSYKQQDKSDETRKKYLALVEETCALLAHPDHSGNGGEKAQQVAGELYTISNDMRYQNNRRAMFEAILAREYGDPVAEIFDRQDAGFERCYEALGIADDRERSWSSLVMAISDALAVTQDGDEREELALELTVAFAPKHEYRDPDTGENCFSALGFARDLIAALASSKAASVAARPTDDVLWDQTLTERDNYHEWADKLANAIAEHFGIEIGEHSNLNNPWPVALEALENMAAQKAHAWRTTEPAVCVPMTEDSGVAALWREAGFDVIELFEHPAPIASSLSDRDIQEAALEWQCDPAFDHFVFHEDELVEYVRGILARVHSAASRAEVLEETALCVDALTAYGELPFTPAFVANRIRALKDKP